MYTQNAHHCDIHFMSGHGKKPFGLFGVQLQLEINHPYPPHRLSFTEKHGSVHF